MQSSNPGPFSPHAHSADRGRARLLTAIAIVTAGLLVQVVGALLSGSLALLADSAHMLSDIAGLLVAVLASVIASRPATDRQTFGFQRAEVLAALINGLLMLGVAAFVVVEAIARLTDARAGAVLPVPMLIVAVLGALANLAALLVLRGGAGETINMKGAYLEVLGDLLGSLAVIVAAVVLLTTGFQGADAIASLLIAAMIAPRAVLLLRDAVHILGEGTPSGTDLEEIRRHITASTGVLSVHDVHVWQITSGSPVFSAHIVVSTETFADSTRVESLLHELSGCLGKHFDVDHSTFQLEPVDHQEHETSGHR